MHYLKLEDTARGAFTLGWAFEERYWTFLRALSMFSFTGIHRRSVFHLVQEDFQFLLHSMEGERGSATLRA